MVIGAALLLEFGCLCAFVGSTIPTLGIWLGLAMLSSVSAEMETIPAKRAKKIACAYTQ